MDLSLENIELVAGSGHLLARLLSSACCPSLQKLQLRKLRLPELDELLTGASVPLELFMSSRPNARGPVTLKLKTSSLRILHLEDYDYGLASLKEISFLPNQPGHIEVDGEMTCGEPQG